MARLLRPSSPAWVQAVLADFDGFLPDHANCERKAAALALSLVSRYPDRHLLVDAMLSLAREELEHFQQVYRLMARRGVGLQPEARDPYVGGLRAHLQAGGPQRLLDQLLVAGVVEMRGCERFGLLAAALPAGELKDLYMDITRSEARHGGLFVRLAREYFAAPQVEARLDTLLGAEAELVATLPVRATFH